MGARDPSTLRHQADPLGLATLPWGPFLHQEQPLRDRSHFSKVTQHNGRGLGVPGFCLAVSGDLENRKQVAPQVGRIQEPWPSLGTQPLGGSPRSFYLHLGSLPNLAKQGSPVAASQGRSRWAFVDLVPSTQ